MFDNTRKNFTVSYYVLGIYMYISKNNFMNLSLPKSPSLLV